MKAAGIIATNTIAIKGGGRTLMGAAPPSPYYGQLYANVTYAGYG
jgi:hypothetical protein